MKLYRLPSLLTPLIVYTIEQKTRRKHNIKTLWIFAERRNLFVSVWLSECCMLPVHIYWSLFIVILSGGGRTCSYTWTLTEFKKKAQVWGDRRVTMDSNLPYRCDYAKSGISKCIHCRKNIIKDEMRLAYVDWVIYWTEHIHIIVMSGMVSLC